MISSTTAGGADAPAVRPIRRHPGQPAELDVRRVVDQVRRRPGPLARPPPAGRELDEFAEPTTSTRSDSAATARTACLPVGRGVADVVAAGRAQRGEPLAQRAGDLRRLVDGERGLHQVSDPCRSPAGAAWPRPPAVSHQDHGVRRLAERALDLLVAGVADQQRPCTRGRRTGGPRCAPWSPAGRSRRSTVSPRRPTPRSGPPGDTPCAENTTRGPVRHLVELVHEHRAAVAPGRATTWALCTICLRT